MTPFPSVLLAAAVALAHSMRGAGSSPAFAAEMAGAPQFSGRRGQAQTCYEVLAADVLPPSPEGGVVLPGIVLARRQEDGQVLPMSFNPAAFLPVADKVVQGTVCCHSGPPPEPPAGDGSLPVFGASYSSGYECTQPGGSKDAFFLLANVADPQIIQEAAMAPVAASLQCGAFNSTDCSLEFSNAERSRQFLGVCSRCAAEAGSATLRSRCEACCAQCPGVAPCFTLPSGLPEPPIFDGNSPTTRLSVPVSTPDGRVLLFTYVASVRGDTCCFEGAVPQFPYTPILDESYRDRFIVSPNSCSDAMVVFIDPDVYIDFSA